MPAHDDHLDPRHDGDLPDELPEALGRDLAELFEPRVMVPAERDAAVHTLAQQHLRAAHQRRRMRLFVGGFAGGAVAAAVMMVAMVMWDSDTPARHAHLHALAPSDQKHAEAPRSPLAAHDLDGNRSVDIVDAMLLARRIESAAQPDPAWDINDDSVVDQHDVDALAALAVRLPEPKERGG